MGVYRVFHECRAIGKLLFGGTQSDVKKIMCFQPQELDYFLSRATRYGVTLFILSTIKLTTVLQLA
jgi:hypothetical protein